MNLVNINHNEKKKLLSILNEAEIKNCGELDFYSTIKEIDEGFQTIWPQWVHSTTNPTYFELKNKFLPKNNDLLNLNSGSPKKIEKQTNSLNSNNLKSSNEIFNNVENIKDEIQELIVKIGSKLHGTYDVPIPVEVDPFNPSDIGEISLDPNSSIQNQKRLRSKKQLQKDVLNLYHYIKTIKLENKNLEDELLNLKENFIKSQKNILLLRKELKKSEIILNELIKREKEKEEFKFLF